MLRNLRLIRKYLTKIAAETLVHSVISNKLDVCNAIFLVMNQYNVLQRAQNSALRFMLNLHSHEGVSNHLRQAHWLAVNKRIYYKYLVLTWKCLNCKAPVGLSSKLCLESASNMSLNMSNFVPFTNFGRRSFSYQAPRLWNALPLDLRTLPELGSFKASLKLFLFDSFLEYLHNIDPYTTSAYTQSEVENYSVQRRPSLIGSPDMDFE